MSHAEIIFIGCSEEDRKKHNLELIILTSNTRGKYFCSCEFVGNGTGRTPEGTTSSCETNYLSHKDKAISWANRNKEKRNEL